MTRDLMSRAQREMFDQAVVASGARRPDAIASDGAVCARLDWFGLEHLEARLSADCRALSFGITLVDRHFYAFRSESLAAGWDAETLKRRLDHAKDHAEGLVPRAYVEWFARMRGAAAERESFRVESPYLRQARPSDLPVVITAAREVFGSAVVVDSVNAKDFRARAIVYESFEIEVTTDGFRHTMRLVAGVRSESGRFHDVPHRHLYEGSWSREEIAAQLTDIRTWCVKVLPDDFLAGLETAYGPLPGVSGHE